MSIDSTKLANVVFDIGQKITMTKYHAICESIDNEMFTLDEHVAEYKSRDSVMGRLPYKLHDATTVLVEHSSIKLLNELNVNKQLLVEFMSKSESNFKKVIGTLYGDQ